ncbi:MAG: cell envelope integrity protein TolA, partial [Thermodesulfobacteriota bacterium]
KAAKEKAAKDAADRAARERQDVLAQALKDAKAKAGSGSSAVDRELANLRKQAGQTGGGGGGGGSPDSQATYGAIVNKLIKQNWRFPQFANLKLICVVELQIGPDGRIQSSRLVQPSGRPDFDNSALRAVQDTGELPKPPSGVERLELTFNSQERR